MERDRKANKRIIDFATGCGLDWESRVIYTTTTKINSQTKKGYMILDEVDTLVFKDLSEFFFNTNYKNLFMIGLTATPYHGKSNGIEAAAIELMGYKLYYNNTAIKVADPTIHEKVKLGSLT